MLLDHVVVAGTFVSLTITLFAMLMMAVFPGGPSGPHGVAAQHVR